MILLALGLAVSSTLSPCELVRIAEASPGRVRLRATYAAFWEGAFLYDPACADGDAVLDVECDPAVDTVQCTKGFSRIARKSTQDEYGGRARVLLEGSVKPWNGLGGSRYQFRITKVISVEPLKLPEPWPSPARSAFMTAVEEVRAKDASFVLPLVHARDLPDSVTGFKLVHGATHSQDQSLADLLPGCEKKVALQQRIFPAGSLVLVQGWLQCADDDGGHAYSIVYVLSNGEWKPALGDLPWMR